MAKSKKPKGYKSRKSKQSMMPIVLGAVGAFAVLAVVATLLSSGDTPVYGDVTIAGEGLPTFSDGSADGAIGMAFPEITGVDFDGNVVSIGADGRPKLVINLAHW
ncbi:MAG: hypothetical protein OEX97_08255 [Acidimicrobiia bacterium]|nr:hypothetical protein [Acidimicrobiia bacterium]